MKSQVYLTSLACLLSNVLSIPLDHPSSIQLDRSADDSQKTLTALRDRQVSAVPVGQIITQCTVPGTVALTFDDGPHPNTDTILNILGAEGVKATFFVNGQNFGSISEEENRRRVRTAIEQGHQIASHTWSHPDLTTLDRAGIVSQMDQLSNALREIIGRVPTYMRAPYFSTNDLVLRTMGELNFHVVHASIDTLDWQNQSEGAIEISVQRFREGLNQGGTIALAHDVHPWTANRLAQAMVNEVKSRGLRAVTVGECLGEPESAWYT
jgi:peptidoglycan/xylan/chitin deacetylase (PgdA/CDA1 family)